MQVESKWGQLVAKKKAKGYANQGLQPKQPLLKPKAKETRIVAVSGPGAKRASCPQCKRSSDELSLDTEQETQLHVFNCRMAHGVDPLLPVVNLRPRPPQQSKETWQVGPVRAPDRSLLLQAGAPRPLPVAALRPLCPPKLEEIRPTRPAPQPPPSQLQACQRANRLALKRLIRAKSRNPEGCGNLQRILDISSNSDELDFRDIDLSTADVAIFGAILADHPSLATLEIGRIDPSLRTVFEKALLDAIGRNHNVMQVTHDHTLHPQCDAKIGRHVDISLHARYSKIQDTAISSLVKTYVTWQSARQVQLDEHHASETHHRRVVLLQQHLERKAIREDATASLHQINRRKEMVLQHETRQRQKGALFAEELEHRRRVEFSHLGNQMWLVDSHHDLEHVRLCDVEATQRRRLKMSEERAQKEARQRERARFMRETKARLMVEDLEQDSRNAVFDEVLFSLEIVQCKFDEGTSFIRFIHTQQDIQRDLIRTCFGMAKEIQSDEEEGRTWIAERRTFVIQMKEQEKAKARQAVMVEEMESRVDMSDRLQKLMANTFEEIDANMQWLQQYAALHEVESDLANYLNEPPSVTIDPHLHINSKPYIFFVGPSPNAMENRVWINTSATVEVDLPKGWSEHYNNLLEKRKDVTKVERDAHAAFQRLRQRNEKLSKALFGDEVAAESGGAADALKAGAKAKNKKGVRLLQSAIKFSAPSRQRPAETPEDAHLRKVKVRGGSIRFRVLPETTAAKPIPEDLLQSFGLSAVSDFEIVSGGVSYPDSASHQPQQSLGGASGDWSVPMTAAECFSNRIEEGSAPPHGQELVIQLGDPKAVLPDGVEQPRIQCDVLSELVRCCKFYSTAGRLSEPVIARIAVEVSLSFGGRLDGDSGGEVFVTCSAGMVSDVVLAQPFVTFPQGVVEREFLEGMKADELQLIPDQLVLTDPPTITRQLDSKAPTFTVMSGGQQGGGLSLSNFHDSYVILATKGLSKEDVICFKNTAKIYFDQTKLKMKESGKEFVVGHVISGKMHTCVDTCNKECSAESLIVIHLTCDTNAGLLAADNMRLILRGLRFANTSLAPVEGCRSMILTVADKSRSCSTLPIFVSVTGQDDPTEMTVPNLKLTLRSSQVPAQFKQFLSPTVFPIAENATVVDVDTDSFLGGSLVVVLSGGTKGEGLSLLCSSAGFGRGGCTSGGTTPLLHPDSRPGTVKSDSERTPLTIAHGPSFDGGSSCLPDQRWAPEDMLVLEGDSELRYDGETIGHILKGAATIDESHDTSDGVHELHIEFARGGGMTIGLCQLLLRRVAITTYRPSLTGTRTANITLTIGETASGSDALMRDVSTVVPACVLTEKVTIRHAPNLLTIPEKYSVVEYREGSGPQRLAPFELLQDKAGHIDHYSAGFISVEIVEGATDCDALAVREDENIKVLAPAPTKGKKMTMAHLANRHQSVIGLKHALEAKSLRPASPMQGSQGDPESPGDRSGGKRSFADFKEKLREHLSQEAHERIERKEDLIGLTQNIATDRAAQALVKDKERQEKYPIRQDLSVENRLVGSIVKEGPSSLYIQFRSEGGTNVTRRNVLAILRNLTYTNNSSDPQVLKKTLKVTISDQAPCFSQCVFELNILTVDDVTEIATKSAKVRYMPHGTGAPTFCIFPYGQSRLKDADTEHFDGGFLHFQAIGHIKGDQLGFLSHAHDNAARGDSGFSTGETFNLFLHEDGKRVMWQQDGEELHVATIAWEADRASCKVQFYKGEGAARRVSLNLASYIMNCIAFSNAQETMRKPITRSYQVRISDGENVQEGKKKITLETTPPGCYFLPWAYALDMPCKLGEPVLFNDSKGKLFLGPFSDREKEGKVITSGFVHIAMEWDDDSYDEPGVLAPGPSYVFKEGAVYSKDLYYAKASVASNEYQFEFTWASKITGKAATSFLRSFTYTGSRKTTVTLTVTVGLEASGGQATTCTVVLRY